MPTDRTSPPFNLGEQTKVRLPLLMLLGLLAVVASAAVVWSGDHNAVAEHAATLSDHESRLKQVESSRTDIEVVKNDVQWIRRTIEQQQRRP